MLSIKMSDLFLQQRLYNILRIFKSFAIFAFFKQAISPIFCVLIEPVIIKGAVGAGGEEQRCPNVGDL